MVRSKLSSVFISLIVLFWALSTGAAAQNSTLKGTVKDITGTPLIGVNVIQKGTTNGTVTDVDGNFSINVPANAAIVFTYIGFSAQEVVWDGASAMNVVMHEDAELLDEVVVVGYGTQKKVNLTGAVDNMSESRLASLHVNTMGEALQGQLPGVYVSTADGKPGRFSSFNIRGTTSINGGDPLIVIDGVPQSSNSLNNLSPNDIEDISILKDAASATIYGARASFGVILITTKTGKKGKSKVEYNNYFGFSKATIVPEIYDNPVDYIDINQNEFNKYIGQSYFTDAQVEYPYLYEKDPTLPQAKLEIIGGRSTLLLGGKVYNYYKEWLRKYTPQQNHRISVSGANDSFQYYLAGDYNYEEGNIKFKPEKIKRYTLLSNLRYNLNKNVSLFNNTTMVKRDEEHPNQYLYGFTSNVYRFIENSNAMMPEYVDIDGKMVPTDIGFYRRFLEKQSGIEKDVHDVKTTLGVDISLLNKDLEIRIDGTYQNENTDYLRWWDNVGPYLSNSFNNRNIVLDYYSDAGPAKIYRSNWKSVLTNINAYGTYSKLINDHDIKVMGGYNQEHYDYLYSYAEKLYPLPVDQHSLNLATGASNTRDDDNRNSSRSIFSRLNYNWKSRYLVEFNTSYFLSSRFEKQKRGHGYLSSSAAWRISEEAFFEPLKTIVPNLKLRFSYGSLGNANIGSYDYIPIMSVSQSGFSLDGNLVNLTSAPAPKSDNFTWETVESFNLGLDFSLFNSKFNTTLDVFRRDTKDMLANYRSLPSVFGASVPKENIASLRTKGWELNVNWNDSFTLLDDRFMYGVYFNVSDYMSQITDYYNPTNYLADYYVGQTIGEIWGLTTLGYFLTDEEAKKSAVLSSSSTSRVYASAGTIKFEDKNNDGVISWGDRTLDNPGDYRVIGNETPRYQFGLTLNGAWKGFDMNVFFNGVGKRDIYPGAEAVNFWGPYNRKYQLMTKHVIENRWTPENPNAYFPKPQGYIALGGNDLGQPQTKYMQNAAYIRLKNFSFGYSLPHDLVKKIKLNSLRFFVSGQNLWEYTKLHFSLDPEGLMKDPDANQGSVGLGTAYPIQRVYSFGAQIQF